MEDDPNSLRARRGALVLPTLAALWTNVLLETEGLLDEREGVLKPRRDNVLALFGVGPLLLDKADPIDL